VDRPNFPPSVPQTHPHLELTDPHPIVRAGSFWRHAAQVATVGVFLILLCAVLELARVLLLPIVSAVVIGSMLGPPARVAASHRIPSVLFASLAVLFFVLLLQAIMLMVAAPIVAMLDRVPEFADALKNKLHVFDSVFNTFRDLQGTLSKGPSEPGWKIDLAAIGQPILAFLTPAVGESLIFLATLFFFLVGRDELRRNMVLVFDDQDDRLRMIRILNDIEHNLTRYMGTISVVNLAVGILTAFGAWLIGFNNPVLLGALAFLCNYIPYIGPAFIVVILFTVGLVSFPSLAEAAFAPALFVAMTTIEGHFITPNIVGKRLTLNPLAVFLSLAFWTWLWGPIGAFLSVPLLIIGLVVLNHLVVVDEADLPG